MKILISILFLTLSICTFAQKIKSIETSEMTLIYDTLGHPIQTITKRENKFDTVSYKNKYDDQNRLISQSTLIGSYQLYESINNYSTNKLIKVDSYQKTKFGTVYKYIIFEYNEIDSVSSKTIFSSKGDTLQCIIKSYNQQNQLISEIEKDFQYKYLTKKEFSYPKDSKIVKTICNKIDSKDTVELKELKLIFNKNGELSRREEWGLNASLLALNGKEISISKEETRFGLKGYLEVSDFEYKYDKFKNWIKLDYYYKGKQKKKNKTSNKRNITYY